MQRAQTRRGTLRRIALLTTLLAVAFGVFGAGTALAAKNGKVLILDTTVSPGVIGTNSVEADAAISLGLGVDVVDSATWATMTTAQFATYNALILGDQTCTGLYAASAAEASTAVWGPAIDGNVIAVGTDPVFHYRYTRADIYQVTYNAVAFAAASASSNQTGIYVGLSCYYHGTVPGTPVPLLAPFGSFTMTGVGCYNDAHIVATHPALTGLTDAILSGWSCSVHEAFDSFPADFLPLAIARDPSDTDRFSGSITFPDGSHGVPYIMARGEGLHFISTIDLAPVTDTKDTGTLETLTATVEENGTPVAGTTVTFTVTAGPNAGLTGSGVTNAGGQATFTYTSAVAGTDTIHASYVDSHGATQLSGNSAITWIVRNADISVTKSGPANAQSGGTITYVLTVNNGGPANATNVTVSDPLSAGLTLVSATPSQGSCSGSVTCNLGSISNDGSATITIVATVTAASGTTVCNAAKASADQPDPNASNNSSKTCAFVYAVPAGGMFVIGNLNATVGTSVTFWGAQWWTLNGLSGGAAPAAFKGFEDTLAASGCGTNWTTDPGNSTPPPAGPLPAFMAVIVSSSISKSGSTISGNTQHIVIVQTNPGYDANPGHAGTGKVVAQLC